MSDFTYLFDLFSYQFEKYPQQECLMIRKDNYWSSTSTGECINRVDLLAHVITNLGIHAGERVAIIVESTSPTWVLLDIALMSRGAIVIPIHKNALQEEVNYIFNDADIRFCFTGDESLAKYVKSCVSSNRQISLILLDDAGKGTTSLAALIENIKDKATTLPPVQHSPEQVATIIYTSGTTGLPKGVMLSHNNIVSNIKSTLAVIPLNYTHKVVSFLPVSHVFERMVIFTYIAAGSSIYFIRDLNQVITRFQEIKPHFFTTVPRLLEGMYESIQDRVEEKNNIAKKIIRWSIRLGLTHTYHEKPPLKYLIKKKIADLLVFRQWRRALGGKVLGIVVGAAAMNEELASLFTAAGIPIKEGYGLTETSPVISINRFEAGGTKIGTVGIPIPGIELKILQSDNITEGEICVRGPGVMKGYWNNPAKTSSVIDEDGWFHTGDIGTLVSGKFLQITDRKKDIFKTSSGKYISPQSIESRLCLNPYVAQSMVVGFQKPFVAAIIVPNFERLKKWCQQNDIHWTSPQYMVINRKIETKFHEEIDLINEELKREELIKGFHLDHDPWSVDKGLLTPTLKIRRKKIAEKFQKEIESIYS